jgi:hypothetical protein
LAYATRTTLFALSLSFTLSIALGATVQAQGLKPNTGSFGSGWQVGGAGGAETGYRAPGATGSYTSPSTAPGSYSESSGSSGASNSGSGSYGSGSTYSSPYSSSTSPTTEPPANNSSPYPAPRSAGGGLRTQ